jgi:glycosyltransferase involved in cell wall biosynthesis
MKIAFDYQIFYQQTYGGISRYFVKLAEKLIGSSNDVHIVAPFYQNNYLQTLPASAITGHKLSVFPAKTYKIFNLYNFLKSKSIIRRWKPDIVHETYYSSWNLSPKSCPTIITVHDMIHELFPNHFSSDDPTTRLKKACVNRADHIICVSENTRLDLMRFFNTPSNKISVVYHGIDTQADSNKNFQSKSLIKTPFLLYVGNRGGYKNFSGFIRAVAISRIKKDFNIIAFGGGSFLPNENQLFSDLGFKSGQIQQLSGDDSLLNSLYRNAQAFIYPSFYEGFGIPPLEAMAHGCPVASSNTSSMPEVIGNAGEFFDPNSIEQTMHAIEIVVYDEKRRMDLITKGKERVSLFSWDRCAEKIVRVYQTIIEKAYKANTQ